MIVWLKSISLSLHWCLKSSDLLSVQGIRVCGCLVKTNTDTETFIEKHVKFTRYYLYKHLKIQKHRHTITIYAAPPKVQKLYRKLNIDRTSNNGKRYGVNKSFINIKGKLSRTKLPGFIRSKI